MGGGAIHGIAFNRPTVDEQNTQRDAKLIPKDVNQDVALRLIEAATQLFVEKGYRGVSIRAIATLANTNSALISYYFGDKEGLFTEVLKNAAAPLNDARMANFDKLEKANDLTVESLVHAWVAPMFQGASLSKQSPVAALSLSLNAEQGKLVEQLIVEIYDKVNERFLSLLETCLPNTSRATLVWRLYFLVGAVLTATRPRSRSVKSLSRGLTEARDPQELIRQLVDFACAGFRAAELRSPKTAKSRPYRTQ